jgi:hypothetical protein
MLSTLWAGRAKNKLVARAAANIVKALLFIFFSGDPSFLKKKRFSARPKARGKPRFQAFAYS